MARKTLPGLTAADRTQARERALTALAQQHESRYRDLYAHHLRDTGNRKTAAFGRARAQLAREHPDDYEDLLARELVALLSGR